MKINWNYVVPKRTAWLMIVLVAVFSGIFTAATTQISLTTQVAGVLPTANGGTGVNGSAVFPSSGTVMTTTTAVAATQLPNPSATTLGGTESISCSAGQHMNGISTSGVPTCTPDTGSATTQAAPTGTINGSNTTFTLSPTPTASGNVVCYLNGVMQQQGAGNDYTISSATITYLTAPPTGAKLLCTWY